ncbi:hypothetical protein AB685_14885 [Bacillus sp. LL01]|uniref:hypothetical protein n=1 Tax=Bacillus sp. LL01 TaxID=1665556 RepID=UPI00064D71DD|nr:hypothetical protein [Bacillus sp. LL01]KMJ58089.1 hypothetical protein AB685_14885 [Bacillus sp. LL01]
MENKIKFNKVTKKYVLEFDEMPEVVFYGSIKESESFEGNILCKGIAPKKWEHNVSVSLRNKPFVNYDVKFTAELNKSEVQ